MSFTRRVSVMATSDIHGLYFPFDFVGNRPTKGSLARVYAYVKEQRKYGKNLILLDNGDLLQGQPTAYYYNYIDTQSRHLAAEVLEYIGYDAMTIGNHDIETGHAVYDRFVRDANLPIMGANLLDATTGKPYFSPYSVFERGGIKVVVLGLSAPTIPYWLPESLWQGMRFQDMKEAARQWVPYIQQKEHPDVLIGLFHSGTEGGISTPDGNENATLEVAREVPGFDAIIFGHDHKMNIQKVVNEAGQEVLCINPSSMGWYVAQVDIAITFDEQHRIQDKHLHVHNVYVNRWRRSSNDIIEFEQHFRKAYHKIEEFVGRRIGYCPEGMLCRDAYFGPCTFIDLIHRLQMDITGADISFAAPLSFDARIDQGEVRVRDMFSLYRFENFLYTMRLTGQEIKDFLEMSYALWTNQMKGPDDHLLLLSPCMNGGQRLGMANFSYNFDSAAGILYTVDVSKPEGERIQIQSMADGTPFDPKRTYLVATNSYRGNGGGELLTKGAGIPHSELPSRIVTSTELDLRYYLMKAIEKEGRIQAHPLNHWRFIPEDWAANAIPRDREILFPKR